MKRILVLMFCCLALNVLSANAKSRFTVGVVTDGPMTDLALAKRLFFGELTTLTEGEFDVTFPSNKQLDGNWSLEKIRTALDTLQNDPSVDFVLGLGFVSSQLAATSRNLRKPTFAPLVLDAQLLGLPRSGDVSGIKNLNYLTEEIRFTDDLSLFQEVASFSKLALIVDETIYQSIPDLSERAKRLAEGTGVELIYVVNTSPEEDIVSNIPEDVDAVMLAALPRSSQATRTIMIEKLIERKIPSFSLVGSGPVERGILMSEAPDSDWQRLARRNALNMQAVMLGERAGDQVVSFRSKRQLTINMATANAIGISPSFDILNRAYLIHDTPLIDGPTYTLNDVAQLALEANLNILASQLGLNATAENINEARSGFRPQINATAGITQFDDSTASVSQGLAAERTTQLALSLSQLLYSESTRADIDIQVLQQKAFEAVHRQLVLDIVQNAAVSFLNVLKARTLVTTLKEDLNLTRTNLELAKDRVRIGSSNAADIYRWESQQANARRDLIAAEASLEQAMDSLNVILDRPVKERFGTTPPTLGKSNLLIDREELTDIVDSRATLNRLIQLYVQQGLERSPERLQLEMQIAAAQRSVLSRQRAYWSPDVSLTGQVNHLIDESRVTGVEQDNESDWQFGINLSLPLYQGGGRRARLSRAQFEQHQLETQKRSIELNVEQSIRASLHDISASFPAIELTEQAASSAQKNLELVTDNYAQGTVSIIDLLDAQNASLNADQASANAVYELLIDYMNLQRSTGEFDFFLDASALDSAVSDIENYLQQ